MKSQPTEKALRTDEHTGNHADLVAKYNIPSTAFDHWKPGRPIESRESRQCFSRSKTDESKTKSSKSVDVVADGTRGRHSACEPESLSTVFDHILQNSVITGRSEKGTAVGVMNPIIEEVLKCAKEKFDRPVKRLNVGSHYELLKVCKSDELDVMLELDIDTYITCHEIVSPCRGFVELEIRPQYIQKWEAFCTPDGYLCPKKMKQYFADDVVKYALRLYRKNNKGVKVSIEPDNGTSPAVTLNIINKGEEYSIDLVLTIKLNKTFGDLEGTKDWTARLRWVQTSEIKVIPVHVVAKPSPKESDEPEEKHKMWRLSFSMVEKFILRQADSKSDNTNRKPCYRFLKCLIHYLKTKPEAKDRRFFECFSTFQLKTVFLHCCVKYPRDEQWSKEKRIDRVKDMLKYFIQRLRRRELNFFFLPDYNMFAPDLFHAVTLEGLARRLEEGALSKLENEDVNWLKKLMHDAT
ncbi:cyclic GMP-AMP synthase-like receptor 1 [Glandiceps talaboti]